VFISNTFRDMQAERDHLVTVVFPDPSTSLKAELRERVEQLGIEFLDVDLPFEVAQGGRWGMPDKTVDREKTNSWEYCRQWINRVEPFFVCILGQRYGWVPAPKQLKDREDNHSNTTY
jgi:nephrocystin-3